MTAEEVLNNVQSKQISDIDGGEDHRKIETDHYNGDAKEFSENGNVGDQIGSESVDSDPIVTVDVDGNGNGVALTDHKLEGESQVTVITEEEPSVVYNSFVDETTKETAKDDVVERNGVICENVSGSDENKFSGVLDKQSNECAVESVESEIREEVGDSIVEEEDAKVRDGEFELESVQNGVVKEDEICVVADVEKSDRELEGVGVENGEVDREVDVEEIKVSDVFEDVAAVADSVEVEESVDSDVIRNGESKDYESEKSEKVGGIDVSDEKKGINDVGLESVVDNEASESVEKSETRDAELESVVDNEVSESVEENGIRDVESESLVDNEVSESAEKNETRDAELENVAGGEVNESADKNEIRDVELDNVVDAEVSVSAEKNKIGDVELESAADAEVIESVEKNEIPVDVNGVCDNTDVKECANEDTQNGLEKVPAESVSDNGVAEVEVSECTEENVIPGDANESERSVEISEPQVVRQGKNSEDLIKSGISYDANEGGNENEPSVDTKNIEEETEVEPSDHAAKTEGESIEPSEMKIDAAGSEAEISNNELKSEADPSIDVQDLKIEPVGSEVEPSTETVESEVEVSNNVVQSEAEVSNNVLQSEADRSVDVQDLKTDAVESEVEPTVEAETSPSGEDNNQIEDDSKTSQEAPATDAMDAQNMGTEVVRKPFYYLIRVPRYDDDENIKELIQHALQQVEEKTKIRDEIRAESQTKRAICKDYGQEFRAALQEERAARDSLKFKRQEMDSVQSTMNRLNNAISVGDIDGKIRNMEHMIQHETLPLKEEKQLIRQIKQLKQSRGELSNIIAKQDQSQSLDDKDSIEEQSKQLQLLRKELDVLRSNVLKAETITKAAKKKYDEESDQLSEVLSRFKAADDIRQEAFVKLQTLKRKLHEKSKYFWEYKNASTRAQELGFQGKKEEVQSLCIDQAERIHEMWKIDEFRRNYIRCNTRSTLRRLQTFDGRMLGPDEEPPVIPPNAFTERASKNESLVLQSTPEQEKKSIPTESVTVNTKKDEPVAKVEEQKPEISQISKAKKPAKPTPSEKKSAVPVSRWGDESDEEKEPKEPVRSKEEEERILKAEKARKEEEEAKLKEMKRLEEIEKAKEALQRKKRNAEKAQQRALYKAQKEAEQKEKEREKRARKKGKRNAVLTADAVENTEQDAAASPSSETQPRTLKENDQIEKPVEVTKRPVKPSQFTKQNKVKSLPMSIRNRGKRRIQPWMWWVLIAVLVVAALFYIGNNSSLRSSFQSFGF